MSKFLIIFLTTFYCYLLSVKSQESWKKARELRLPGELRVVNEGVAHDDKYWYFSNQHFLYKTTVKPVEIVQSNHAAIPDELKKLSYDHIGDIDIEGSIIYGGLEAKNTKEGILATWSTETLNITKYVVTTQDGMPWVAIDVVNRKLYSAPWNSPSELNVYNMDTFDSLGVITIINNDPNAIPGQSLPKEIQGGAFYEGDLYLATNLEDGIWKVNLSTNEIVSVLSDKYPNHEYEMEGLTFWDLRDQDLGVMHMFGNFMQLKEKCLRSYSPEEFEK